MSFWEMADPKCRPTTQKAVVDFSIDQRSTGTPLMSANPLPVTTSCWMALSWGESDGISHAACSRSMSDSPVAMTSSTTVSNPAICPRSRLNAQLSSVSTSGPYQTTGPTVGVLWVDTKGIIRRREPSVNPEPGVGFECVRFGQMHCLPDHTT